MIVAAYSLPEFDGWYCDSMQAHWLPPNEPDAPNFYGFRYQRDRQKFFVGVPYWFLILLFSGLLFFVWRWTRAKGEGRGFEVIVQEKV